MAFASFNPYCWFSHNLQRIRSRKNYPCSANPSAPATPPGVSHTWEARKSKSQMMLLWESPYLIS